MTYDIPITSNLDIPTLLAQYTFLDALLMEKYYKAITQNASRTSALCTDKSLITTARQACANVLDWIIPKQCAKTEKPYDVRPTQTIGTVIHNLSTNVVNFQSNNPKRHIEVKLNDMFVSKKVSSLMLYGALCSIYNQLKNSRTKFTSEETNAIKAFSKHLATMKADLPNYLNKCPADKPELDRICETLNYNVLHPVANFGKYSKILDKCLPFDGCLFNELVEAERSSYQAFTSGFSGCIDFTDDTMDPVAKVLSLNKGIVVVAPIKLYFEYMLRFFDNRLAQPDMQNAEDNKIAAMNQLTAAHDQPYHLQLQMAKEYLATHQQ